MCQMFVDNERLCVSRKFLFAYFHSQNIDDDDIEMTSGNYTFAVASLYNLGGNVSSARICRPCVPSTASACHWIEKEMSP